MTIRKSDLILPGETLINKPTFDVDTSGGKRAQRVKAGESKLPGSSPLPALKPAESRHTEEQQSLRPGCTAGAARGGAIIAPRGALLPRGRAGASERGQDCPGTSRGPGACSPTLSSTKSHSRDRRLRPPRGLVGRCPITVPKGTPGGPWRVRAPPAAAHNGELRLPPQTVGAEAAPGWRMLPFQSPCACSLSFSEPGVLPECARRCGSLTAKDGEGGDRSGRGSAAAAATKAAGGDAGPRGEREAGAPHPARGLAAGYSHSAPRTHKVTAASQPPTGVRLAVSYRWTAPTAGSAPALSTVLGTEE